MRSLADFAGDWHFRRLVTGADGSVMAEARGELRLLKAGAGLIAEETAEVTMPGGSRLRAERKTLWREDGQLVAVDFADGRPFHRFDPRLDAPVDLHLCDPDRYEVRFDLAAFPRWRTVWRVMGPRKAYEMVTDLARDPEALAVRPDSGQIPEKTETEG